MMNNGISIKIEYWGYHNGQLAPPIGKIEGLEEFRADIGREYLATVHGRVMGRGGGAYRFAVEFISNVKLSDVVVWIAEGVAYDMLKSGSDAFVLRPFLDAFNKLKASKQTDNEITVDVSKIKIVFQDSVVIINDLGRTTVLDAFEDILKSISDNYKHLALPSGEMPYEIHIPIFEDPAKDRIVRFRELLSVDENIRTVELSDFFKLWGLNYNYSSQMRVYDVKNRLLIDEWFYTEAQYWNKKDKGY